MSALIYSGKSYTNLIIGLRRYMLLINLLYAKDFYLNLEQLDCNLIHHAVNKY